MSKFVDFPVGWGTRAIVDRTFEQAGVRREIAVEVADVANGVELVRLRLRVPRRIAGRTARAR